MRVHEIAKEFDLSSKEVLEQLHGLDIEAKSHMSALNDDEVTRIKEALSGATATTEEEVEEQVAVAEAPAEVAEEGTGAEEEPVEEVEEEPQSNIIIVKGPIVVKDFATELGLKPNQLIAELMMMNVFASINEKLEIRIAQRLAEKHGFVLEQEKKAPEPKPAPPKEEKKKKKPEAPKQPDQPEDLITRPPIVTFLGHVDHGKTSLLDRFRHSRVVDGESGGITQHIGAYQVECGDQKITFLDTPGHAAFTAMRARGANLTDIAILVVAADDGLMPQTREAIQHVQASGVTMMVAINKIDTPGANVDRVKQQLQQEGLTPEDWGGELICCPVSAITGEGLEQLLEMILLQSEILELRANPRRKGQGYVIEARLEPGMGPTASLLVRKGTLHVGDAIVCGPYWGRVKALINDQGIKVRTAGPSAAVKCLGLTNVPEAGSEFDVYPNAREAKAISAERMTEKRSADLATPQRASLEDLFAQAGIGGPQELTLILKADVKGSLEAIEQSLREIKSDKVALKFILSGVGNITENDVLLASASNAIIVGFHVGTDNAVSNAAKHEGVEIRLYSVIYELLDDVREAMTGMLEPETREKIIGHAEVRQIFVMSKRSKVAGCMVTDGRVSSRAKARVQRQGEFIYDGSLASLKRFQNDANEIREGQECGIRLDNFLNFAEGDIIEFYEVEKIAQEL